MGEKGGIRLHRVHVLALVVAWWAMGSFYRPTFPILIRKGWGMGPSFLPPTDLPREMWLPCGIGSVPSIAEIQALSPSRDEGNLGGRLALFTFQPAPSTEKNATSCMVRVAGHNQAIRKTNPKLKWKWLILAGFEKQPVDPLTLARPFWNIQGFVWGLENDRESSPEQTCWNKTRLKAVC